MRNPITHSPLLRASSWRRGGPGGYADDTSVLPAAAVAEVRACRHMLEEVRAANARAGMPQDAAFEAMEAAEAAVSRAEDWQVRGGLWLWLWLWLCCCGCVAVAVLLWLWLWLCGCVAA